MGQRRHQRVKMVLPVRIVGHDTDGKPFSVLGHTLDFSRMGARLGGMRAKVGVGAHITVEYKNHRGRFEVRWVSDSRPEVGVQNLEPEKFVFLHLPEEKYFDDVNAPMARETIAQPIAAPGTPAGAAASPAAAPVSKTVKPEAAKPGETRAAAVQPMRGAQLAELKRKLRESKEDIDSALQRVAEASRELLSASGAAVAIAGGGEDWICRAGSGVAPRIGVRFQAPQGLTGEAIETGQAVICNDTEADPRVNASIWRSLQLRSTASVPIMSKNNAVGVLEVFWEQPNGFSKEQAPLLRELAELLAELLATFGSASD